MFDPRIYRAALIPAVAAFVLLMFSLEPVPSPLPPPISAPTFEGADAARDARAIVELAPQREPGSDGDLAVADLVRERFSAIEGGEVSTQDFTSSFEDREVDLQNVLLTLPGSSERSLLIVAQRDSAEGPGAASSAAATATLLSIAETLAGSRHERTLILASTDGGSDGAAGIDELAGALPALEDVDAALVISQPGAAVREPPYVISSGTGPDSASAQLVQTARAIASGELGDRDEGPGPWVGLSRLAVPIGLGEQAALRRAGIEAVAISPAGERPIPASEDGPEAISTDALGLAGSAVLDLVLTLDEAERPPADGPDDYIRLGDKLIPGWTMALLALALLAPALLAAADTWLREQRFDWRARRSLPWAAERALIPGAALLLAYGLGIVGLVPAPRFPYDPSRFPAGIEAPIAFVALAAAVALSALLVRPTRTPLDAEPHTLAAASGLLLGFALLGLWLLNPYLALLLAPAAHVWLLPARASGPPRAALVALAALLALVPAAAAFATVAAQLDLGASAPWHLLLLVEDGQIGLLTCLLLCALLGGLIAGVAAASARGVTPIGETRLRGSGSHAGPGSLGATRSALPRR